MEEQIEVEKQLQEDFDEDIVDDVENLVQSEMAAAPVKKAERFNSGAK